jgi:RNA polymerase sigma-70 factor (ECF subfamily)
MGLIAAEPNGRSHDTEALYREHGAAVAALCRSLLRDRGESEDATQQVFLSAHRALLNGTVLREPLAWLLAVARNECYARFRERAVTPVPAADPPEGAAVDASVHVLRAGDMASVWDELGHLPEAQREVFLLREIRGLSYGQLADELSLSPPSVRSLLLRARSRLRQRLRDVAALGWTPWLQGLLRFAGGEGSSPVPAATKAAAVGLGALALVGGGAVAHHARHAAPAPPPVAIRHPTPAHARPVAAPAAAVAAAAAARRVAHEDRATRPARVSSAGDDGSNAVRSRGSDDGATTDSTTSGSRGGSGDGSDGTTSTQVVQQTDGRDGSSSGSDGGSSDSTTTETTATTTTTTPDGDLSGSGSDGGGTSDGGSSSGTSGSSDGGSAPSGG